MSKKYNNIEVLICSGQLSEAQEIILRLAEGKLDRKATLEIAQLCRMAGLYNKAFQLLHPLVRSSPRKVVHPSLEEKAEYASNLIRMGATSEGMEILKALNPAKYPAIHLFFAYGHFTRWEYGNAIPHLESYLKYKNLTEYEICIGKVNLAASYVIERWDEKAEVLLSRLLTTTKKNEFWRLYGNVLELTAQFAINQKDWIKANHILTESENILSKSGGLDLLFTQKWRAVSDALRNPGKKKSLQSLNLIRESALKLKHWETVRDCDLFLGATTPNPKTLIQLFYGTPYVKYRQRIFEYYKLPLEIPTHFLRNATNTDSPKHVLHMDTGEISGTNIHLIPGQMPLKIFKILSSDFYRPFRLPFLHSELYPGEYFNPISSPLRVHQALSRFRKFLKESELKVEIQLEGSTYRLGFKKGFAILLSKTQVVHTIYSKRLEQIAKTFLQREFSISEVQQLFGCSSRTAQRILHEFQESGKVDRIGASSSTRYRLSR